MVRDGIVFKAEDGQVIFNQYSFCELVKHLLVELVGISYEDPSQTTLEWWERFCFGMLDLAKRCGWAETRSGTVPQNHSGAATEVFRMSHSHT